MKLTAFILLAALIQISAKSPAQTVTISQNNISLGKVFRDIHKQTGYNFLCTQEQLSSSQKVSLNLKNAPLKEVLDFAFRDQPLTYSILNKTIIVKHKKMMMGQQEFAPLPPPIHITGTITDSATGDPLVGVTIQVKENTIGTTTDVNGHFSLEVPDDAVVVISYVGYNKKEIPVGEKTTFNITLSAAATGLNQLVVVGYGTQKLRNVTGAISQISGNTLENIPSTSVSAALQGRIAGVTIQKGNGRPGTDASIEIRGKSSLNSTGKPLVLVDGVQGNLNNLDPNDIESITVLKDASTAAIYGARASNGVILIKTKTGNHQEKLKVKYSFNFGYKTPTTFPEKNTRLLNAKLFNIAYKNAGSAPKYSQKVIEAYSDPNVKALIDTAQDRYTYVGHFDWIHHFLNHGLQYKHTLSVSGGGERNTYFISGSWLKDNGYFSKWGPDNFDRYGIRVNNTFDLIPNKLQLVSHIHLIHTKQLQPSIKNYSSGNWVLRSILRANPDMPLFNPDGTYARFNMEGNPLQILREGGFDRIKNNSFEGVLSAKWHVTNGLTLNGVIGYNVGNEDETIWRRAYYKYEPSGPTNFGFYKLDPNSLQKIGGNTRYYNLQFFADYERSFGNNNFNLLLGTSSENSYEETTQTVRDNISGNNLPALNLGSVDNINNDWNAGEWSIVSGFARLRYDYNETYLLEGSLRADASSRFSKKHRVAYFPSISAGWRVDQESFMKNQTLFSSLKLHVSYGEVGNQGGLGLYDYIPTITIPNSLIYFPSGREQQAYNSKLASPDRTWETIATKDIGLDMSFLDDRLTFQGDYFIKNNKNMLIPVEYPAIIGIAVPTTNSGTLQTKGWDVTIKWESKNKNPNFNYYIGFNIADQTNKLTYLGQKSNTPSPGFNNIQGYPINSLFGYQANGYFQSKEELDKSAFQNANTGVGDIKYVDQNKDKKITAPADLVYLGNEQPRYTFGLNIGGNWKRFDFSIFFQGIGKRHYYLANESIYTYRAAWMGYSYKFENDYWTPDNRNALYPRPYLGAGWNFETSSHWMQNAAYIRLKNMQIGYVLPSSIINKIGISKFRVYFSGSNLWTASNFLAFDPEIGSTNAAVEYPLNKVFSFGINVTF